LFNHFLIVTKNQ